MTKLSDEIYRDTAKRLYGTPDATVPLWSTVQRVRGGAFVGMTVRVPEAEARGIEDERALNALRLKRA